MSKHCNSEDLVQASLCSSRYIEKCSISDGSHSEEDSLIDVTNSQTLTASRLRNLRCHSRSTTSSEALSTVVHFPEISKAPGCGKGVHVTSDFASISRDRQQYSTGLLRYKTRNDLTKIDLDQRLGSSTFDARLKKNHRDKKRHMQRSISVTKEMKKKIMKKFLSFSKSAERCDIRTIAYL
jgi:hypothetical protein